MKTYTLLRTQYLPLSLQQAWDFFSTPRNLEKITPESMSFKILTKLDDSSITEGMRIEYIVKPVLNIPMHWVTLILNVDSPRSFTDKQLKGPYALWEHTHTFEVVPGGIKMTDEVKYALPLGPLGILAHILFVKQKLANIFDFRAETLTRMLGTYKTPQ